MRGDYYHCKRRNIIVITINVTIRNVNRVSQITVSYVDYLSCKNMIIVTVNNDNFQCPFAIIVTYYIYQVLSYDNKRHARKNGFHIAKCHHDL